MVGLKGVWKGIKRKYRFTDGVDAPIIVRYCRKHQRFEWYDPCNKWGGITYTLSSLKNSLKTLYWCGQCGRYHVENVVFIGDEETMKIRFLSFINFIR